MGTLVIARIDAIEASRDLRRRLAAHPIGSAVFVVWLLLACALGVFTAFIVAKDEVLADSSLAVHPNTILLGVVLLLTGKSIIDANYRVVENRELVFLMLQPIPYARILYSKFLGLLLSNAAIMAVTVGAFLGIYAWAATTTPQLLSLVPIPAWYLLTLAILVLWSSAMGFTLAFLNSLPLRVRIATVPLYSLQVYFLNVGLRVYSLEGAPAVGFAAGMALLALLSIRCVTPIFPNLWAAQTSGKEADVRRGRTTPRWIDLRGALQRFLHRWLPTPFDQLVYKELVINIQKKEVVGNLMAILGLSGLLLFLYDNIRHADIVTSAIAPLIYPAIIALGVYLAALLQCGLIGLSTVGKEGKKFWILRSVPLRSRQLFVAKAIAILLLTPLTIAVVSIPLPLLLHMPLRWVAFFVAATVAAVCAFTGLGLWAGATFPNFDEARGGTPDIMSMYLLALLCLGVGMLIIGAPGLIMGGPPFGPDWGGTINGVLATLASLLGGIALLLWGILRGARRYDRIEVAF